MKETDDYSINAKLMPDITETVANARNFINMRGIKATIIQIKGIENVVTTI